ncbi:MAG: hypothetical protein QNJ51_24065 [Calothrix sp. MO_167.B12]|nr:hypothetical protein [Calothrix sp. MO_167.B12]
MYQAIVFPSSGTQYRPDVKSRDLEGNPDLGNIGDVFRAVHRYAEGHGFISGFPSFEEGVDPDNERVYGMTLLEASIVDVRSVAAIDLGSPNFNNVGEMVRAAHRYARSLDRSLYVSGYPLFEQGRDAANNLFYGVALVKFPVSLHQVPADALGIFRRFSFDATITGEQMKRLLQQHVFAVSRITNCSNLNGEQKNKLRETYRKNIKHGSTTRPGVNAFVPITGADARMRININFGNLFPLGNDEIAQTLIHEMMHCAGYDHRSRQATDVPFDGGDYYGTLPLVSEICIAGNQTLTGSPHRDCTPNSDGYFM